MAFERQQNDDLRATLTITQDEAIAGTKRTVTLPGGRQVTVPVPPGVRDGQEIRLAGQREMPPYGSHAGALVLTIAVAPTEYIGTQFQSYERPDLPKQPAQAPPSLLHSSPNNNSAGAEKAATNYPLNRQDSAHSAQPQAAYSWPAATNVAVQRPGEAAPQQPLPQKTRRRRGLPVGVTILLLVLALLLIGGGILAFYTGVYRPGQLHAQATATVQTSIRAATGTANAEANATAAANATATVQAEATAAALQNTYTQAMKGSPTINDPLSSQDGNNWDDVGPTGSSGGCAFAGQVYHVSEPRPNGLFACFAQTPNFSNFALQVQATILKGDYAGIIFRADSANTKYYYFRILQNGAYDLTISADNSFDHDKLLRSGTSSTFINTGANSSNTLGILAKNNNIYLYVNNHFLDQVNDATYKSGSIGFFSGDFTSSASEATFSNLKVWTV